ncbi:aspartyl-tRNA(Asn)/glutamyl-tRNA(Gln) amidotransferase subunit A [Kribbella amoyensis]|uniref:Aspartyl-tRNA(Asn)/glutamyl-tRNA(Gln) amidotransferase subunit A n=1 Tax=Kribbella amoyensis TaxID=996641 RepID=A0A561BWT8_9ACTN|nr:aspartyl-tRNA(Asn)/glutamyl-tRNA(Gln) amidotransferase subunit A [Kribbella amoyensis]
MRVPQAVELVAEYRLGTVSPVEATRAALEAIERFGERVNAFVLVDAEGALAAAKESESRWRAGEPLGPGDGVPTSIKDALWTRGWPTLRGSTLIDEAGPWDEDAPCVARLRETGAVILGKTTTPEYSWKGVTDSSKFGATGNPWDPAKTSGGSSGGSATAVGLGMGAWSVGTDGGGSVRIPAAFTGTVALKPTYGLIPLFPPSAFGTLSHAGPMTRTVKDNAALLDVISGYDARDWSAMPTPISSFLDGLDDGVAGLRIGFSPDLGFVRNDPEVDAAVRAAIDVLADAGAKVDEVDPGFADPIEAFNVLWFSGAAKVLQGYGDAVGDKVDPGLRRTAEAGADYTASDFLDATAVRMELGRLMGQFHRTYDVLITPTLPLAAFPVGQDVPDGSTSPDWTSWTPYTYPFNLTQQPALSVPCGFTSAGLPIGLQIVGARHADALVLRVGQAYQAATDWHDRTPVLLAEEAR